MAVCLRTIYQRPLGASGCKSNESNGLG